MSMIEGVLAGMAQRTKQQTDAEDREALRKKRKEDDEDRAFTMSERQRALKMRQDMGNAAAEVAPVEVKETRPDTMDNRDVGQAGEAPLPTAGYDVNGKRYGDAAAAAAAAKEQNTPQAVTSRMADVAMRNGEPLKAQQLRTGAMEEQTAQFKLNDAMRADLDAKFNADLQANVKDWDSLDKFISDSAGDGHGGQIKVKSVVSPDGKTRVVNVVGPDGSLTPTDRVVPNTPDGFQTALAELARMPAERKLAHLHSKAMLAQQATRDAEASRHNTTMEGIAKDNTAAKIEIAQIRADAAAERRAAAAKAAGGMTLADLKDGHKGIATTLNADWKTQIESETDPTKLKALKVARENEIATVQRLYTGAMQAGFGLTPEQAIVAFRSGETATQKYKAKDGSGTVEVNGILYGSRFIPLADNPGAAAGAPDAPASKTEAILRDAASTGTKDFVVDINGRKQAYGNAKLDDAKGDATPAAPTMQSRVSTEERIPAPPPAKVQQGIRMADSPAYAAWLKKYGADAPQRYAAQQEADQSAKDEASAAARKAFNPYAQLRVN